jgi:glycosyltransferase involved in cell wall biosynthesis
MPCAGSVSLDLVRGGWQPAPEAPGPCVTILLSTFNGARFLPAQLQSFLAQSHGHWRLYWRDDGSSDDTVAVMHAFAARLGAGRCRESPGSGPHLGAAASFLALLGECRNAETLAFADQDDVWLPGKLTAAISRLATGSSDPALYCARQYLVDERLAAPRLSVDHGATKAFPACLAQNIVTGNTVVMNRAAAGLVAAMPAPEGSMHDWWSFIAVSACGGKILFDREPQLLYRQHAANLIGIAPMPMRALAALRRGRGRYLGQIHRHLEALAVHPHRLTPETQLAATLRTALQRPSPKGTKSFCAAFFKKRLL